MSKLRSNRSVAMSAVAVLVLLAGRAAQAQSIWTNAAGGVWSNSLNWNNSNVPDNGGESAIIQPAGPYTVVLNGSYLINALSIVDALARLDIQNGFTFTLSGGMSTAGPVTVNNSAGGNSTLIRVNTSQTWSGPGKVVLNANAGSLDTAYITYNGGGEVLTLASGKQIVGSGNIYVSLVNNGGVIADSNGRVLELLGVGKTNNAEFAAISGGILRLTGINVSQSPTGVIRSYNGSTVIVNNATSITSGKLQADPGATLRFVGVSGLSSCSTSGLLDVDNGARLDLSNSLVNDGDLRINDGSGSGNTHIRVVNSTALDGVGTITLRSNGTSLDTAYLYFNGGGEVLTQGAQHTIRGSGNIYVGMVNNGTIRADTAGRTLKLLSVPKTNNNSILADGSRLEIESTAINQGPGGVISLAPSAGSSLAIVNSTVNSGLLQSVINAISVVGTSVLNNTTINGPMLVENAAELRLTGGATSHTGDLFVNTGSGGSGAFIRAAVSHTVSGPGRIVLRAIAGNLDTAYLYYSGGGEVLTQSAGHSIVGTGGVYVGLANAGLVSANQGGRVLELRAVNKSNTGVMNAVGGGVLRISGITVTQTGAGVLRADGGQIESSGGVITGGLIESINGGSFDITGLTTLSTLTLKGPSRVIVGNELRLTGGTMTNDGTITVNPTAANASTYIRSAVSETVAGTGAIVLNANPANLDSAYIFYNGGGEILTNGAAHTIRGTGRIYVGLVNEGTVAADASGRTLELVGVAKTNKAEMVAKSGGTLQLTGVNFNQSSGAVLRSEVGSAIAIINSNLAGGLLQTGSDALADGVTFSGNSSLNNIELLGAAKVVPGGELRVQSAGIVNNSVLTINSTGANNSTFLRAAATTQISGSGVIMLNANPANLDSAYLFFNGGGEVLTLDRFQTLGGLGRVYVRTQNNGTLSPGNPAGDQIGQIDLGSARFSQGATGAMRFEISGPAADQFDRVTGTTTLDLAGRLNPVLVDGYQPPLGTSFDVINGPAIVGTFSQISPGFDVQYFPNKVRVIVSGSSCPGDINRDGLVDDADFNIFVVAYDLLDCQDPAMPALCPSDINRDGFVDDLDFQVFAVAYADVLCP